MNVNTQYNQTQDLPVVAGSVGLSQKPTQEKGLNIGTIVAVVLSIVAIGASVALYGAAIVTLPIALLISGGAIFAIWLVKGIIDGVREELKNSI